MNQHLEIPTTSTRSLQRVFVTRLVHIFVISFCRGMLSFPFGSRFSALNNSVVLFGVHIHRLILLRIVLQIKSRIDASKALSALLLTQNTKNIQKKEYSPRKVGHFRQFGSPMKR